LNTNITINDVADMFLTAKSMKLRKLMTLCYYSQAYHLSYLEEPLFEEDFESWIHGPASPKLFEKYYEKYGWSKKIPKIKKVKNEFDQDTMWVLELVKNSLLNEKEHIVCDMPRYEEPWLQARGNLSVDEVSKKKIDKKLMKEYYYQNIEKEISCPKCNNEVNGKISSEYLGNMEINICKKCKTSFILLGDGKVFIRQK